MKNMKGFYLGASLFFTVLLLIIAFENINASLINWVFFFFKLGTYDTFFMIIGITLIGFIIGVFFTLLIKEMLKTDEEAPGSDIF